MESKREIYEAEDLYGLYQQGMALLEAGDYEQATVPLSRAAKIAPEKGSIREALGRALFHCRRYREAATEFEAIVDDRPVDDYAQFCLGRALTLCGQREKARHHLAIAACLRPDRRDYRTYRDQARASAA